MIAYSTKLPVIDMPRKLSLSPSVSSKRRLFERKLDRLKLLITQSESSSPNPGEQTKHSMLSPTSGVTPLSRQITSMQRSATNGQDDFVSEMLSALKDIIMQIHSPGKTKVTLANAQKFIHLRRQSVPLKEAIKLSAKKIRDSERQDIDTLLKHVTLLKFSEEHYDYEHITKQYELFQNTHNIVNGLIVNEKNEGYASEVLDPRIIELTKAIDRADIVRRRRVNDFKIMEKKHDFKLQKRKHFRPKKRLESVDARNFSSFADGWVEQPPLSRVSSDFKPNLRRSSQIRTESLIGSIRSSHKSSSSIMKPFVRLPAVN